MILFPSFWLGSDGAAELELAGVIGDLEAAVPAWVGQRLEQGGQERLTYAGAVGTSVWKRCKC